MALPSSGALSLLMIQGEFGGPTTNIAMNQYYAGGSYVPAGTSGNSGAIPSSGQISISQFYGSQSLIPKGYFAGGDAAGNTNRIDGIRFDTEAAINPAATLSQARQSAAGINSSARGFVGGGSLTNTIDGIRFDTEAAINPAATLSQARQYVAGINSSARGFFGGGLNPTLPTTAEWTKEIDGIRFDTEAAINPSAELQNAPNGRLFGRAQLMGFNSQTKGYFAGGKTRGRAAGTTNVIDDFRFDTEACARISATLSQSIGSGGGVNSTARGFSGGGQTPSTTFINTITGIRFDTEAAVNPAATLSQARRFVNAGFQSGAL